MIVGKQFKFDAAHFLPGHLGKCRILHGHTWTVEVEIEGPVNPETGMVLDFTIFKDLLQKILDLFDHQNLNDTLNNPTCENLVSLVFWSTTYELGVLFPCKNLEDKDNFPQVHLVRIQEGTGGWACLKK